MLVLYHWSQCIHISHTLSDYAYMYTCTVISRRFHFHVNFNMYTSFKYQYMSVHSTSASNCVHFCIKLGSLVNFLFISLETYAKSIKFVSLVSSGHRILQSGIINSFRNPATRIRSEGVNNMSYNTHEIYMAERAEPTGISSVNTPAPLLNQHRDLGVK